MKDIEQINFTCPAASLFLVPCQCGQTSNWGENNPDARGTLHKWNKLFELKANHWDPKWNWWMDLQIFETKQKCMYKWLRPKLSLMITNRGCRPMVGQPPISCSINNNTAVTRTYWLLSVFFNIKIERQTYKYSSCIKSKVSDILHLSFKLLTASTTLITINVICMMYISKNCDHWTQIFMCFLSLKILHKNFPHRSHFCAIAAFLAFLSSSVRLQNFWCLLTEDNL